jgi:peptidylprolyl isomerase
MTIAKEGSRVKILLEGKLEDGTVFDRTDKNQPIEFTVGREEMLQKIDVAVRGMKIGEKKDLKLEPEEAFGPRREELIKDIPRSSIVLDKEPKVGATLLIRSPDGMTFPARIMEVKEDVLKIDFNHPLAGKTVIITIELVSVE